VVDAGAGSRKPAGRPRSFKGRTWSEAAEATALCLGADGSEVGPRAVVVDDHIGPGVPPECGPQTVNRAPPPACRRPSPYRGSSMQ